MVPVAILAAFSLYFDVGPSMLAARQPPRPIEITFPAPEAVDIFGLRFCPADGNSSHDVLCNSVGTRGAIEQISWNSDLKSLFGGAVEEASYHFDRNGVLDRTCRRGHVDFQGRTCSGPNIWGLAQQRQAYKEHKAVMDAQGRLVSAMDYGTGLVVNCSYEGAPVMRRSVCRDGEHTHVFEYDETGRRTAYHRRRIPKESDPPGRASEFDRAVSLDTTYEYKDDAHGNWESILLTQKDGNGQVWKIPVQRIIKYY